MTEAEWLVCEDPESMLTFLRGRISARKRRLLACACAASVWDLLHRKDRALIAWQRDHPDETPDPVYVMAQWYYILDRQTAQAFSVTLRSPSVAKGLTRTEQAVLLREVAGNPFRDPPPLPVGPSGLGLAQAAFAERRADGTLDPARLAVLSDALEEAGCTDEAILTHLRSPGPHVRGCWAVDLLLGRS